MMSQAKDNLSLANNIQTNSLRSSSCVKSRRFKNQCGFNLPTKNRKIQTKGAKITFYFALSNKRYTLMCNFVPWKFFEWKLVFKFVDF